MSPLRHCILLLALVCLSACATEPVVVLRGEQFRVEIKRTAEEQARGMMFRDHLDADAGMLFVYDEPARRTFWMRNCRIPLDILYFDAQARLVGEALSVPPCNTTQCPTYDGGGAAAQYVLELNAGTARRMGVQRGDVLTLPALP